MLAKSGGRFHLPATIPLPSLIEKQQKKQGSFRNFPPTFFFVKADDFIFALAISKCECGCDGSHIVLLIDGFRLNLPP
jgi:hypothetical protein